MELTREEIICVNKLAYDYHILPEKDPDISNLFMSISNQINNVMVIRLSGILGINGARVLSMIANSSFKEEKNIHRVNTFLVKCNIALSVLNIVDIYCILYERFTYPFIYTMLETNDNLNDEQKKRFDYISLAILSMLDSMTLKNIKIVLANYAYTIKLYPNITKVRFSLKSAKYYTRILKVIEDIELDDDKLIVP